MLPKIKSLTHTPTLFSFSLLLFLISLSSYSHNIHKRFFSFSSTIRPVSKVNTLCPCPQNIKSFIQQAPDFISFLPFLILSLTFSR